MQFKLCSKLLEWVYAWEWTWKRTWDCALVSCRGFRSFCFSFAVTFCESQSNLTCAVSRETCCGSCLE